VYATAFLRTGCYAPGYGFYAFTGDIEHFFFFIEIEKFRGEGKMLKRHTHDTTFLKKFLIFTKFYVITFFYCKTENISFFY
jgi:hypothetical protein